VGFEMVDERRGVDVDVAVAGVDRETARRRISSVIATESSAVLLRVELVVVALEEHRACQPAAIAPARTAAA
jgi:hypothetical protein